MPVETEPGRTVLAGARGGVACLAALLGACAGPGRPAAPALGPAAPLVVALDADHEAAARGVAERARDAEVVYLGELHDNPVIHVAQATILRAMVARGARPALAFEMVAEGDQAELTAAVRSAAPADEVGRRLRWAELGWPDFQMYWPLFELARRAGQGARRTGRCLQRDDVAWFTASGSPCPPTCGRGRHARRLAWSHRRRGLGGPDPGHGR